MIYFVVEKDHVAGLPRLAALQDSNDSFCIFRKFGPVDQLVTRLNELDNEDLENSETRYRLHSTEFYDGCDPEQRNLIKEIEAKIKDYCLINAF